MSDENKEEQNVLEMVAMLGSSGAGGFDLLIGDVHIHTNKDTTNMRLLTMTPDDIVGFLFGVYHKLHEEPGFINEMIDYANGVTKKQTNIILK